MIFSDFHILILNIAMHMAQIQTYLFRKQLLHYVMMVKPQKTSKYVDSMLNAEESRPLI